MSKKNKKENLFNLLQDENVGDIPTKKPKPVKPVVNEEKPEVFSITVDTTNKKKQTTDKKKKKKQIQPKEETPEEKRLNDDAIQKALEEIRKEMEVEEEMTEEQYQEEFQKFVQRIKTILRDGFISAIDAYSICETCSDFSTSNKQQKEWIDECQKDIVDYYEQNKNTKADFQFSYEISHKIYKFNLKKRNLKKK